MMSSKTPAHTQSDKFKQAARELGCDENEARWDERLRHIAKQRSQEKSRD
jgi:hypothetical protein